MLNYSYSEQGIALTKSFEGLRLNAYQDGAGVWTIGYGHTGPEVHSGLVWTEQQAADALLADIGLAIAFVNHVVIFPIAQHQFDPLCDFTFNMGRGALQNSTLLRMVNVGNMAAAAAQFLLWVHAAGVVEQGLVRRRKAEAAMFIGDEPEAS